MTDVNKERAPERAMEAEYMLEYPALCPGCQQELNSIQVVRLLRTRVNFTSTLPRGAAFWSARGAGWSSRQSSRASRSRPEGLRYVPGQA